MKMFLATVLAVLLAGCSNQESRKSMPEPGQTASEESTANRRRAAQLITQFANELRVELMSAIKEGGAALAVSVCRDKAPELALAVSRDSGVVVRRVSENYRNSANCPTREELDILARLADTTKPKSEFWERWTSQGEIQVYYYYQPIRIMPLCLRCHGREETISADIRTALKENYPQDRATGYRLGDLRGMFVVEMPVTGNK